MSHQCRAKQAHTHCLDKLHQRLKFVSESSVKAVVENARSSPSRGSSKACETAASRETQMGSSGAAGRL